MEAIVQMSDLLVITPLAVLFVFGLVPIAVKVVTKSEPSSRTTLLYVLSGFVCAFALQVTNFSGGTAEYFSGRLIMDGFSHFMIIVVLLGASLSLTLAKESREIYKDQFSEFAFLFICSVVGMITLCMANDLVVLFIGLELMSLALYLLIAMSGHETLSKEASFKYFIYGSFASAFFLYGAALLYGGVGSTRLDLLIEAPQFLAGTNRMFFMGWVLVLMGLCFKVSAFPLVASRINTITNNHADLIYSVCFVLVFGNSFTITKPNH